MSLSTNPIKNICIVRDPRIDFEEQPIYAIGEGGSQVSYKQYPATSYSPTNITIPTTQSPDVSIASKVFIRATFQVNVTGTPVMGGTLLQDCHFAPRFMPFSSVVNSTQIQINSSTFTQQTNQYFDALMHYNNTPEEMGRDLSGAPSFIDEYQSYSDAFTIAGGMGFGTSLNALGKIGECDKLSEPRGGWDMIVVGNTPNSNACTVTFTTYEPVLVSPLTWGHHNTKSFIGVNSMNFTFNFDSNLARVLSIDNNYPMAPTGLAVTIDPLNFLQGPPVLEFVYITPRATQVIEKLQRYPFNDIQYFGQDFAYSLPPRVINTQLAQQQFAINNITLIGVPARMFIFGRIQNKDRSVFKTDTFLNIYNLNMQFDNQQGIFAQASEQQLHRMSAENGSCQSWQDWHTYQGSILCIDFSKDVPLNVYTAQGSLKNIQMQYTIIGSNLNLNESQTYTIYTVISYDGVFSVDASTLTMRETNMVSPSDVVNRDVKQRLPYHSLNDYATSKFGGKISNIPGHIKRFVKGAKDVYNAIPANIRNDIGNAAFGVANAISPRLAQAIPIAESVLDLVLNSKRDEAAGKIRKLRGKGYNENQIYLHLLQGGYIKKKHIAGGKKLSKADIKRLAY